MLSDIEQVREELHQLQQDNTQIKLENIQIKHDNTQIKAQFCSERLSFRVQMGLAFLVVIGAILISPANRGAIAQGYGTTLQQLLVRTQALENKTQFVSISSGEMFVKGTNLHIENGIADPGVDAGGFILPRTFNGKGNLIIGYNESRGVFGTDMRTGSHNLIIGDDNNYASEGGQVVGFFNTISSNYASVSGGRGNTASGRLSSISGGAQNTADGGFASISGGLSLTQSIQVGWSAGSFHTP